MGFWRDVGHAAVRTGTAIASGGASEAYRAATGKADPFTAYGEKYADQLAGSDDKPPASSLETAEERQARLRREAASDADLEKARAYSDWLNRQPAPQPRAAPRVGMPGRINPAQAGAPTSVTGSTITGERVASTFNGAPAAAIGDQERQHADYLRAIVEGGTGPSAAALTMRQGIAQGIAAQRSLAAGHKGYSDAPALGAQRQIAVLSQGAAAQGGILRAQEEQQARQEYSNLLATTRAQDLSAAGTEADLALRASTANQSTNLEAQGRNQANALEVQRLNQAAKLQTDLANAGFNQQAILQMSDQELRAKLANAGFQLSQEQIDDLRAYQQRQQQLEAQGQVLSAGSGMSQRDLQIRQLQMQYDMAMRANAQNRDDARLNAIITGGAALLTGPGAPVPAPTVYDPYAHATSNYGGGYVSAGAYESPDVVDYYGSLA